MPPSFARLLVLAATATAVACGGEERPPAVHVPAWDPIVADEPFARDFSAIKAARSLDGAARYWSGTRKCAACHTLAPYLMARPALNAVSPEPAEARLLYESIVARRMEAEPNLHQEFLTAGVIWRAAALALHDRANGRGLSPHARRELDRMWVLQREDGGWTHQTDGAPPLKSDESFATALAAVAAGAAPGGYARGAAARSGLSGVRRYFKAHPPSTLHQKVMLLWASARVDGLLTPADRLGVISELSAAQRPDGGWSLASLVDDPLDERRRTPEARKAWGSEHIRGQADPPPGRDEHHRAPVDSDGYATGLTVYVLRQAGLPARDARLRRGVAWLKSHQRESGRWFTPSQAYWYKHNLISNAGSAYAIMALHACGEIP